MKMVTLKQQLSSYLRTRVKICGLTRPEDIAAAVTAGADAIGFVFYPPSPRYVTVTQAAALAREVPPFITQVGLFVNVNREVIVAACEQVPLHLLQFHGDETPEFCAAVAQQVQRPFVRAARVAPGVDLLEFARAYESASALLLDAPVAGYGGGGATFDWSLIPQALRSRMILSGGLTPNNVADAVTQLRPYAVDVSSGVESAKGIKNAALMRAFVQAVQEADRC